MQMKSVLLLMLLAILNYVALQKRRKIAEMKNTFICPGCGKTFTAEGLKQEKTDPIYGYTWKYVAASPCCSLESGVYKN
jgi:hypothetical protein